MSAFEGARADIIWQANTGQAIAELGEVGATYARTTGAMSDEALRMAAAQEKLTRTIARSGPESTSAKNATIAYRRELAALAREENVVAATAARTSREQVSASRKRLSSEERSAGRFARGGAAGLLSGVGGRALAFGSTAFIGGVGLEYGLRAVTKAAEDHQVAEGQLEAAVTATGLSFGKERDEIEKTLSAQQRLGFTYDESVKAFNLALRATGSVAGANRVLSTSADVARGSGRGLLQSTLLVTRAYNGQIGGLRRVGISLKEGSKGYDAVAQAQAKFAGAAESYANSAAGAQARLSIALHETEVTIGQALLPTVTRLSSELANWLNKSKNQEKIQRDVNEALHVGGVLVHDAVVAFHLLQAILSPVNKLLGGTAHEVVLVGSAFLAWKTSVGIAGIVNAVGRGLARIGPLAARGAAEVVTAGAAAAVGEEAIGVAAAAAATEVSAVGAAAAAATAETGGLTAALLGLGAPEVLAALAGIGIAFALYKGLTAANPTVVGKSPSDATTPGGANIVEASGKYYIQGAGGGRLTPYHGPLPPGVKPRKITSAAAPIVRGVDAPSRFAPLPASATPQPDLGRQERIQLHLSTAQTALARGDKGAQEQVLKSLREEIDFDRDYEKKQQSLIARGIGDRKAHIAILERLQSDEQSALGQVQSIEDQNASKAKDAADKEKAAADKRKAARDKLHREREKELRDQLALREKNLRNNVARAALTKNTLDDDSKALANLIAFDKAQEHNQNLTKTERASYVAKELAAKKQLAELGKKQDTSESRDQIREFLSEFENVVSQFAPNYQQPGAAKTAPTVNVSQHFPHPPTDDGHREATYAAIAARSAFYG